MLQLAALACAWGIVSEVSAASLSWRFAGLNALRDKKELVTWKEVSGLPEFAGFETNLVRRVASTLAKQLSHGEGNEAELIGQLTPISADLIAYPTIYELDHAGGSNTWTLAIQIPEDHHATWTKSWDSITKAGKSDGAKVSREGQWTVLGNGSPKGVLDRAKQQTPDVLQIEGDGSFLQKLLPGLKPTKTELHVSAQGNSLRSDGKIQLAEDLPFHLTPWEIPANTIREPLLGFTAIQGVSNHLARLDAFKKHPSPNQLFIWNEDVSPFSAFAAVKVDDPKSFVEDFAKGINLQEAGKKIVGNLELNTNTHRLSLMGLPIVVPFVGPAHPDDPNFIFGGFMPIAEFSSNAMPAELKREVASRTNLVYYDWELTGGRAGQLRPLTQLVSMATRQPVRTFDDPASKWLIAAEKKLGNAITEISTTGPRELTLIRRSTLGPTALELIRFVNWVAGPPTENGPPLAR